MSLLALAFLAQLTAPARLTRPVLSLPEPGMDDDAAYEGYSTRFFRDAARNTVQIYLERRTGRVVHLLADADNESIGFTVRGPSGAPVDIRWSGSDAQISSAGRRRTLEYRLVAGAARIDVGHFLLGSMRVERDYQASGAHRDSLGGPAFALPELAGLAAAIGQLPPADRLRHLALLDAADLPTLRARLQPTVTVRGSAAGGSSGGRPGEEWTARVVQPSLDARDTIALELRVDPQRVVAERHESFLSLRARSGTTVTFTVRVETTAAALTPLSRDEIFSPRFLAFAATLRNAPRSARDPAPAANGARPSRNASPGHRARWVERQMRGVELLASREKLMAGLPTYATYFGRDMLVTALMMRPVWRDEMSEFVIASVLRRLSPTGQVSHEEALGGQAVRESAAEYSALVTAYRAAAGRGDGAAADSLLARAGDVLRDHRRVRENYHMIDDELQLPVLVARWVADPDVPPQRKRAFLADSSDGNGSRLARLLRELALVSRMTERYAADPVATNLVSFVPRDSAGWSSASWRDSNAGYAGGRFAMDVNAIWAPHALESMLQILAAIRDLGFDADSLARAMPNELAGALGRYVRDPATLRSATDTWWDASRHFTVRLAPREVRSSVAERLAAMPAAERGHWTAVLAATGADRDSLAFLAIALDAAARPIGVVNSDPATRLFLGERAEKSGAPDSSTAADVLRDVRLFVRAYPVGLFIDSVGPVVANDAYAPPAVWHAFERDPYHGPRVAWGREINLFLLGVSERIAAATRSLDGAVAPRSPADDAFVRELRAAIRKVTSAVEASGFGSELWSYTFDAGRPSAVRYGSGADVQLWSTTDLAVQFALSQLGR